MLAAAFALLCAMLVAGPAPVHASSTSEVATCSEDGPSSGARAIDVAPGQCESCLAEPTPEPGESDPEAAHASVDGLAAVAAGLPAAHRARTGPAPTLRSRLRATPERGPPAA